MILTPIVVRDHTGVRSEYAFAPVGMKIYDALRQLSIDPDDRVIRRGDVLRDLRVAPDDAIATGDLALHAAVPERSINPDPCIRCGWCVEAVSDQRHAPPACSKRRSGTIPFSPRHLAAGLEACIDCGICSFVCPSKLPLLIGIRKLRAIAQADEMSIATGLETVTPSNAE